MDIIHHEIDPLEQMFVNTLERAYVEEVNRLIMIRTLDKAKEESEDILAKVQEAHTDAMGLRQDLEDGNSEKAADDIVALARDFEQINLALSSSLAAFEGVNSMADEDTTEDPFESLIRAEQIMLQLEEFSPEKKITAPKSDRWKSWRMNWPWLTILWCSLLMLIGCSWPGRLPGKRFSCLM